MTTPALFPVPPSSPGATGLLRQHYLDRIDYHERHIAAGHDPNGHHADEMAYARARLEERPA